MRSIVTRVCCAVVGCHSVVIADVSFTGIGVPPGRGDSAAYGVSADGRMVVAASSSGGGYQWTREGGFVALSPWGIGAYAVSADGRVIGGQYAGPGGNREACIWTDGTLTGLGRLPLTAASWVTALSADGSTAVGWSQTRAFVWTPLTGIMGFAQPAGGGEFHEGWDVSADGSVIVGTCYQSAVPQVQAARWTAATGTVPLGAFAGSANSQGRGVSADGRVVVGASGLRACRWTESRGLEALDPRGGPAITFAHAVSGDGTLVVGRGDAAHDVVLWTARDGTIALRDLLAANGIILADWTSLLPLRLTPNGRAMVGDGSHRWASGQARTEGWIAELPAGMACYANCDGSTVAPVLSIGDLSCFLNRFVSGDAYANCDDSAGPAALNVNDFMCFLNRFAAGCP